MFHDMLDRVRDDALLMTAAFCLPGIDPSRVVVEPPRDPTHGDMATNAAMVLAKDAGKKPRELAEAIADEAARRRDRSPRSTSPGPASSI